MKDIKFIAWYLPQFHVIPENDLFWGNGFTEWTNVKKAVPLYTNHYQPRLPHNDIGFYDLSDWHTLQKQAEMARKFNIYGFCFYRYWFNGKSLLQKPLDLLLQHPEIDINYCLCWANENWTRKWNGADNDILIKQTYSNDSVEYIANIEKWLKDPRYIKNNGKPILLIYRPYNLPNPTKTFELWRKYAKEHGIGEIEIYVQRSLQNSIWYKSAIVDGIDAEVEFPPLCMMPMSEKFTKRHVHIRYYNDLVNFVLSKKAPIEKFNHRVYRGIMLGFDNTARNKQGVSYVNFSFQLYEKWLKYIVNWTEEKYKNTCYDKYVFINAWNEWGEGTYLEPDQKFEYTALNITSNILNNQNDNKLEELFKYSLVVHVRNFKQREDIFKFIFNKFKLCIPQFFKHTIDLKMLKFVLDQNTDINDKNDLLEKFIADYNVSINTIINNIKNPKLHIHCNDYEYILKTIACILSHLLCVYYAKLNNWPYVLIFEDDACPSKNAKDKLLNVINYFNLYNLTNIIMLGYNIINKKIYYDIINSNEDFVKINMPMFNKNNIDFNGMQSYIVPCCLFDKILQSANEFNCMEYITYLANTTIFAKNKIFCQLNFLESKKYIRNEYNMKQFNIQCAKNFEFPFNKHQLYCIQKAFCK